MSKPGKNKKLNVEVERLRDANEKMKVALKEISAWCADILNADRGEVPYQLREFAGDVYGRVHEALGS